MSSKDTETRYFVTRTKESDGEESVIRLNVHSGLPTNTSDFDSASKFETFEEANEAVEWFNSAPSFIKQDYNYYVVKHDTVSSRLDESGNVVDGSAE